MDLDAIRREIDSVDRELVALFEKRMDLVGQVAEYKRETGKPIFDPEREATLLDKVGRLVENKAYQETIQATFSDIMIQSRRYQAKALGLKE
ncbi:chorismate mutase [Streptococcus caprae]|uniref:Chorismate mutase n=1 Tax=Streptococcus caprae TaxID=1640501 RepID=A0ABV8CX90_9STRE